MAIRSTSGGVQVLSACERTSGPAIKQPGQPRLTVTQSISRNFKFYCKDRIVIRKPTEIEHLNRSSKAAEEKLPARSHRCRICGANFPSPEQLSEHEAKHLIVSSHVR
jgi:hypothetical protein